MPENNTNFPAVSVNNQEWTYHEKISSYLIKDRAMKEKAHNFNNKVIVTLSLISLLIFLLPIFIQAGEPLMNANFFRLGNPTFLFIALSIFLANFIIFRKLELKIKAVKLPTDKNFTENIHELNIAENRKFRSISSVFSKDTRKAIDSAFNFANQASHEQVTEIHLLIGLLETDIIKTLFARLGLKLDQIIPPIQRHLIKYSQGKTILSPQFRQIIVKAFSNTVKDSRQELSPIEIFEEVYESSEFLQEVFYALNVEREALLAAIDWMRINEQLYERYRSYREAAAFKPTNNMNRAYTALATPFLDKMSEDLTAAAVHGHLPMLIDREKEMNELLRTIEGGGRSVILVAPTGVGKMAMIAGLAERMVEENVPKILQDKRLLQLSVPQITSGGNNQEKLLMSLREAGASGNIILVIDGLDQMLATDPTLGSVLVSELEKHYTFIIATSTAQGYRAMEQTAIPSQFSVIRLEEPSREENLRILESRIGAVENKNRVFFTFEALAACVDLSNRYLHDQYQPEKSILLAQEAGLQVSKGSDDWQFVTKKHIADLVSEKSSVPVQDADDQEKETLVNLEELIHHRVIGQDHAVKAVSSALRRARTQLKSDNRPIANFLFLGPTGVGKTELAKSTAEVFFGQEDTMIRFDMSEYQEQSAITRLIGDNGQGGLLTEAVRQQPYGMLLLDELEKAHPDLLNLFLQVMDDGRLTDGAGRTVDFTNIIIIATSNAGTEYIQDSVKQGEDLTEIKNHLMENELRGIYRPEFLNRFDEVIVFTPLTQNDVVAIAYLLIDSAKHRLETKGIQLQVTDALVHELAEKGFDPKFGARPLRRVIQDEVDNRLADILLKEKIGRRDSIILDIGGQIKVEKAKQL